MSRGALIHFIHKRKENIKKDSLTSPHTREEEEKNEQTGRRLMLSSFSFYFFEKSATNESITAPCAPALSLID